MAVSKTDNDNDHFNKRDIENKAAYDKKAEDSEKAVIEAQNLLAEEQKQQAYKRDVEIKQEMAARAEAIKKENADAYAAKQLAEKEMTKTLREERENFNYQPDFYKNINFDKEYLANLKASADERTLDASQKKAFDDKSKDILNGVSEKTVDLRNANYATELQPGATQVINKDTINLLQSGDRQSTAGLISQLEQRSARLNEAHEERLSAMADRADFHRENGDEKTAAYLDKKIEHETCAFERDRAKNVLAQYEFMDSDRPDSDRIREQRTEIKALSEKADALYAEVEQMEAFDSMKEQDRDHDYMKEFRTELDANAEIDDFKDVETDEEIQQDQISDQQYEDYMNNSDQDVEEFDPYAAEMAAHKALDEEIEAVNSDREYELFEEENPEDRATRIQDEQMERHNDAIERGDFDQVEASLDQESDIQIEKDEDTRSHEDIEQDTFDNDVVDVERRYEYNNGIEFEAPDFSDSEFGTPDFDDVEIDVPVSADKAVEKPAVELPQDFEFDAETGEVLNDTHNELASVSEADRDNFKDKDFLNKEAEVAYDPDADKKFKADFTQRLNESKLEIDACAENNDYAGATDAMKRHRDVLDEYNSYLADRETLNSDKQKLDDSVDKLSTSENSSDRDKGQYFQNLDKANDHMRSSEDKPWGASMQAELKETHSKNEAKLDAVSEGKGQKLHSEHRDQKDVESEPVRVLQKDNSKYHQAETDTQTDKDKDRVVQH